jgi:hypothetical protein
MVALTRRSRLYRAFRPIVDGLFDKARKARAAAEAEQEWTERDWREGGQWQRSHPFSYELEIIESTSGNPLNTLGRAIDSVHRGEIMCVALIGLGTDGVIHTAWSDGDYDTDEQGREASLPTTSSKRAWKRSA